MILKGIRNNTKAIIWTVVVMFVLWGGFSFGTQFQKKGRIAGEIFGREVTFQEYDLFERASRIFTPGGEPITDATTLKRVTWDNLIYSREAKNLKLDVSDEEVRAEVVRLLEAQKVPSDMESYRRFLAGTVRETPQDFERQIREWLRIQKLIKKVREGSKTEPPTDEEVRQQFDFQENKLAADAVFFSSPAEAQKFKDAVKNAADWDKQVKEQKLDVKTSGGLIPFSDWMAAWQITDVQLAKLIALEKDAISAPVQRGSETAVFRVLDKKPADEAEYEKNLKEKYRQVIIERGEYDYFIQWNRDVMTRARLQDHTQG